jgi:GNAT superfamily N-acetyltransferase
VRVLVQPLQDAEEVLELAEQAEREGYRFVTRLIDDWREGSNRFDGPGEAVFAASIDQRIVGVCGLNVDPYVQEASLGRVRHLYVLPDFRRSGVGSVLMSMVIDEAARTFERLRLRTRNPGAAVFYEALGFEPVVGDTTCTHQLPLKP